MKSSARFHPTVVGLFLCTLWLVSSTPVAAQAQGMLFGIVVDDSNDAPVAGARVQVVGTSLRVEADANGVFVLRDIAVGRVNVRIDRPGYSAVVEQAEIREKGAAVYEMRLVPMAIALQELSVTARRRSSVAGPSVVEVGSATSSDLTAADLVSGIPGLSVGSNGGLLGSATGIRIRGTGTFTGSSAPSVYLDGILLTDPMSGRSASGRTSLSVLSQIPAKDVARILVLRGPSAGAAYSGARTE